MLIRFTADRDYDNEPVFMRPNVPPVSQKVRMALANGNICSAKPSGDGMGVMIVITQKQGETVEYHLVEEF